MRTTGRTFTPELPESWKQHWRQTYCGARGLLPTGGRSVLAAPQRLEASEAHRLWRFGPVWGWWVLNDDEREEWWNRG